MQIPKLGIHHGPMLGDSLSESIDLLLCLGNLLLCLSNSLGESSNLLLCLGNSLGESIKLLLCLVNLLLYRGNVVVSTK